MRRYWPHAKEDMLGAQSNIAGCLGSLGRDVEALVLIRDIYAGFVATLGLSHENTLGFGNNLVLSLDRCKLWDESKSLLRDQLLPAARRSLGFDHDLTLRLGRSLAVALTRNPESTRDDLLEAESIMQDVVQRRRRVFGPAHPHTKLSESLLSYVRERLHTHPV
mmetsp:Transcript_4645/g.14060  ORF Transcript_4645/g.14060 Transcript_4645/m.14060 type:complete len:164 (-) Transcript_4645:38-529(-)